jgi:hypothetical protein
MQFPVFNYHNPSVLICLILFLIVAGVEKKCLSIVFWVVGFFAGGFASSASAGGALRFLLPSQLPFAKEEVEDCLVG